MSLDDYTSLLLSLDDVVKHRYSAQLDPGDIPTSWIMGELPRVIRSLGSPVGSHHFIHQALTEWEDPAKRDLFKLIAARIEMCGGDVTETGVAIGALVLAVLAECAARELANDLADFREHNRRDEDLSKYEPENYPENYP